MSSKSGQQPLAREAFPAPIPPQPAGNTSLTTTASLAGLSVAQLLSKIESTTMTSAGTLSHARLRELARSDPAALNELIRRLETETDGAARDVLVSVLSGLPGPEVLDLSRLLASGNPAQRRDAYALLSSLSDTDDGRGAILKALDSERDPGLLSQAVKALRPATVDSAQAQATIEKLSGLAKDIDPRVRGASVQALAQWDKAGAIAEPAVYQALADPHPEVRSAALYAVMYGEQLVSDRLKASLIDVLRHGDAIEARTMALGALQRFQMTSAEHAIVNQAKAELKATTGIGGPGS
jgi:hypothetical protein